MSETKPEKRLVSKGRYVRMMGRKMALYTFAGSVLAVGLFGLLWMLGIIIMDHRAFSYTDYRDALIFFLICGPLSLALLRYSKTVFSKIKAIERVELITAHNAHLLPAQETLLRGSDLPPTVQQAELLRATQAGQETAQEQRLWATTGEE